MKSLINSEYLKNIYNCIYISYVTYVLNSDGNNDWFYYQVLLY